jgi:hypothetical protein
VISSVKFGTVNILLLLLQGEGPVEVCEGPGPGTQPTWQGQALRPPPAAGQGQEMKNLNVILSYM